jgi:hypothetical protein
MSAGHRSLTRRDAFTDKGAGHDLFIRYFLAAAKANGSSLSIVLPFISVFTLYRCHFQFSWCWASSRE